MKVAVPVWEGRVSPVLDTARQVRCFEVENGQAVPSGEAALLSGQPQATAQRLQELGVSVLLCGAVSQSVAAILSGAGIRIVPFLAGKTEEIAQAFAAGRLRGVCYQMPGCCGRARRHRRGRCGTRQEDRS